MYIKIIKNTSKEINKKKHEMKKKKLNGKNKYTCI